MFTNELKREEEELFYRPSTAFEGKLIHHVNELRDALRIAENEEENLKREWEMKAARLNAGYYNYYIEEAEKTTNDCLMWENTHIERSTSHLVPEFDPTEVLENSVGLKQSLGEVKAWMRRGVGNARMKWEKQAEISELLKLRLQRAEGSLKRLQLKNGTMKYDF